MGVDRELPQSETAEAPSAPEFELLQDHTEAILSAARMLLHAIEGKTSFNDAWPPIRDLEHKGDAIARDVFEMLATARGGPVPSDALQSLMGKLDDVLDGIEAAAARLAIHRIRRVFPPAVDLAKIVLESARELREAVRHVHHMQDVFPHTRTMHLLENRGDDVLREAIGRLFAGRATAKDIIKWKDICEMLEDATDRCEDIANIIETFVVQTGAAHKLAVGGLVMDVEHHEVTAGETSVPLSAKEFSLLHLLLRHQGKIVRRERLLRDVWGEDYFGDTRTLDTHVAWLRKKIETAGGVRIVAVRGIGYRLDVR
ncbi:MAG TPA: DUF47 family protein [bacterium]|nr:DUF47 family protein [bacterium]